jgi:inosine-uridine nucleoside N-ribohydrolase
MLSETKRVIIDTDCGVDDAVALLWALTAHLNSQQPSSRSNSSFSPNELGSCQLLAITCCSGNTHCDSNSHSAHLSSVFFPLMLFV